MTAAPRAGSKLLPIDWGAISPLRLRARIVAEGVYAGMHRSLRRGAGIEFGGQRPYVVGDDIRFLDRRSLLRHDKLMVREFETDTDRAIWLVLDASASMSFRGPDAPGAKLAYAALCAAALARVALAGGDPVGLVWMGGRGLEALGARFGSGAYERLVSRLEDAAAAGDLQNDTDEVARVVRWLSARATIGSVVLLFSDLLDLSPSARRAILSLSSRRRALVLIQVLDPRERDLSFRGKVRLRAIEGSAVVVTDADGVRPEYRARLAEHTGEWRRDVERQGGRLVEAPSDGDAVAAVRRVLHAVEEVRR